MANPFEIVIQKLISLGFYDFLFPFIITAAIFYALLRKTKVLGESPAVNAALALSVAFLIFGYPVIVGFALGSSLSVFFTQGTVFILILLMGFLVASFFYPDLGKFLSEAFTRRTTLMAMVALAIALFVTSGLVNVFTFGAGQPQPGSPPSAPVDVITISSAIIIFVVLIIIAAATMRGV